MMDKEYMLTTIDNPYDPFEDFDSWLMFDKEKGYNCCEKVARIAQLSDDMSEKEINEETDRAIDEIIKNDFMNVYKKVRMQDSTQEEEIQET